MKTFNLPDLGEGLPDAEIVDWHVKVGDEVKADQPLVAMETAKAVVDVPAPVDGIITKLHGNAGDIIATGAPLVEFDIQAPNKTQDSLTDVKPIVGKPPTHPPTAEERADTGTVAGKIEQSDKVIKAKELSVPGNKDYKVSPIVRAIAKKLHVDLGTITPSGPDNTITREDVEAAAPETSAKDNLYPTAKPATGSEQLKGTRRVMAQTMAKSHAEVVPVTIYDDAKIYAWQDKQDITVRVIKALQTACEQEPALNAWFDTSQMSRKLHQEINLGIAMDSEDGLFVPVIKDIRKKDDSMLRTELNELKELVAKRQIPPEQMKDFTIILSNFGKFAGKYATPVVVPPTVAILAVGKLHEQVVPIDGNSVVSKIIPLSLSFDHRACTGGEASRFLGHVVTNLEK